jgi:hypothetical protein
MEYWGTITNEVALRLSCDGLEVFSIAEQYGILHCLWIIGCRCKIKPMSNRGDMHHRKFVNSQSTISLTFMSRTLKQFWNFTLQHHPGGGNYSTRCLSLHADFLFHLKFESQPTP